MPGITHLVLGSLFGLLLYNMNPQRFTRKHAFIFAMNSYIGPDLLGVIGIGPMYAIGHLFNTLFDYFRFTPF